MDTLIYYGREIDINITAKHLSHQWHSMHIPGRPYGLPGPELAGDVGPVWKLFG